METNNALIEKSLYGPETLILIPTKSCENFKAYTGYNHVKNNDAAEEAHKIPHILFESKDGSCITRIRIDNDTIPLQNDDLVYIDGDMPLTLQYAQEFILWLSKPSEMFVGNNWEAARKYWKECIEGNYWFVADGDNLYLYDPVKNERIEI
jgi:hypothetical protein